MRANPNVTVISSGCWVSGSYVYRDTWMCLD
jgi:hypothetical protein